MGELANISLDKITEKIRTSNKESALGNQKYIYWENKAIIENYEFIPCECDDKCWCRQHSCTGHYRIKKMTFEKFIDIYVTLWTPPQVRDAVKAAVLKGLRFDGRQINAVKHLRRLQAKWDITIDEASRWVKCGLCNILPKVPYIENLYEAKIISQLYYDVIIPFDTASRNRIISAGYDDPYLNYREMNRQIYADLNKTLDKMSMQEIRFSIDMPWKAHTDIKFPKDGQPISRIIDKMFYSPKQF
jgi:hypothetical protein